MAVREGERDALVERAHGERSLTVARAAGDFAWQRIYDYAAPIPFDANTRFRVTCDYDTSTDTEPVRPGWGTQNEMCFVLLMVAMPPGVSL